MPGRSSKVSTKQKVEKSRIPRTITIPPMNMTYFLVGLIILGAFVLGFVLGVLVTKVNYLEKCATTMTGVIVTAANAPDIKTPVDVSLAQLRSQGYKNAKVSIVEFADIQCPYCGQRFKDVGPTIIQDYVD